MGWFRRKRKKGKKSRAFSRASARASKKGNIFLINHIGPVSGRDNESRKHQLWKRKQPKSEKRYQRNQRFRNRRLISWGHPDPFFY